MRPVWKYAAAGAVLLLAAALLIFLDIRSAEASAEWTCKGVKVEFADQGSLNFVTEADVKNYITKDCGPWKGKTLEEIDLAGIEACLNGKSAILSSEAYVTTDGILHLMVSQREPVIRFVTPSGGWYADREGFVFPLQKNYTSRVMIVDGNVPLKLPYNYKGLPKTAAERRWVSDILAMVDYISSSRQWRDFVGQIHIDASGKIVLVPRTGDVKFIFGRPEEFGRKFGKIEDYYKYIVPAKGEKYYSTVNVSFGGQIVCRK
ncbi:MAG: cell division protein FtsQ/DivIB [Candidatus Cryptobacteroides sp.]|nr:hypothetical protein [Bacteroidales bacterium]